MTVTLAGVGALIRVPGVAKHAGDIPATVDELTFTEMAEWLTERDVDAKWLGTETFGHDPEFFVFIPDQKVARWFLSQFGGQVVHRTWIEQDDPIDPASDWRAL